MKKVYLLFSASIFILACFQVNAQNSLNTSFQTNSDSVTIKTFKTENGWGYDIYISGKKYIHQEYIPVVNGNKPFVIKEDAEKTAELVKIKIKKNILPPSVTIYELDSIGIKR